MTATDNSGTGAVGKFDVGGVTVTADQLADAIGALESDHSTSVKQPLQQGASAGTCWRMRSR